MPAVSAAVLAAFATIKATGRIDGLSARLLDMPGEQVLTGGDDPNKIAMQMARQLVGVTMQEQGVSRIVAVDIESALQLAAEAA